MCHHALDKGIHLCRNYVLRKAPGQAIREENNVYEESENENIMDFSFAFTSLKMRTHLDDPFSHTPSILDTWVEMGLAIHSKRRNVGKENSERENVSGDKMVLSSHA